MKLEDFIKKHGNVNVDEKELKKMLGIKDKKYFIPNQNESYYFVDFTGYTTHYINQSDSTDSMVLENNEVFRTKEEAEEHAKKQRFLLKMKRDFLDNSDEIDWSNGKQDKFYISYSYFSEIFIIDFCQNVKKSNIVTTNVEWLKEYIDKYREEIKKYYFEIKEEK